MKETNQLHLLAVPSLSPQLVLPHLHPHPQLFLVLWVLLVFRNVSTLSGLFGHSLCLSICCRYWSSALPLLGTSNLSGNIFPISPIKLQTLIHTRMPMYIYFQPCKTLNQNIFLFCSKSSPLFRAQKNIHDRMKYRLLFPLSTSQTSLIS